MARRAPEVSPVDARDVARKDPWLVPTSVGAGALLTVAHGLTFWFAPQTNGTDAVQKVTDAYARTGGAWRVLLAAEPLGLLGILAFLLFLPRLAGHVRKLDAEESHRTMGVLAAGASFIALFAVGIVVGTTPAGSMAFSKAAVIDPQTAMLLGHMGFVAHAVAMIGAAVLAGTLASVLKRSRTPRWLGTAGYAVAVVCAAGIMVPLLPMILFAVYLVIAALALGARAA